MIVDAAVESGGNCEVSYAGERRVHGNGVIICGPSDLPSRVSADASQMYSRNVLALLQRVIVDGGLVIDLEGRDRRRAATFSGSFVGFGKLQDLISGRALVYRGRVVVSVLVTLVAAGATVIRLTTADVVAFWDTRSIRSRDGCPVT